MEALFNKILSSFSEGSSVVKYSILAAAIGVLFCFYGLWLSVYRLYFHPLAGFPGPRLAAATRWYEFYYDVVKRGQYIYKIEEMHEKYGTLRSLSRSTNRRAIVANRSQIPTFPHDDLTK